MFRHDVRHTGVTNLTGPLSSDLVWSHNLLTVVESSPAVVEGLLYVGASDRRVYALRTSDGTELWNYSTEAGVSSSPAVVDGIVYVGSSDSSFYALNASTGGFVWSYTAGDIISSSPVVVGGVVYVGAYDGKLYSFNASTGEYLWHYTSGDSITSSPAVDSGIVYFGSHDGKLYAINASTGGHLWNYSTGDVVHSSPAVSDGIVYVGSNDDRLYAINISNRQQVWNYSTGFDVKCSPAVGEGLVYFAGEYANTLYAVNASTGQQEWSFTMGGSMSQSSPALSANGVLYIGAQDLKLYALNASTGEKLWEYGTGNIISSSPAVVNNVVYFGSVDGNVYAIGESGAATTTTSTTTTVTGTTVSTSSTTTSSTTTTTIVLIVDPDHGYHGFILPVNISKATIIDRWGAHTTVHLEGVDHGGFAFTNRTEVYCPANGTVAYIRNVSDGEKNWTKLYVECSSNLSYYFDHLVDRPTEITVGSTVTQGQLCGYTQWENVNMYILDWGAVDAQVNDGPWNYWPSDYLIPWGTGSMVPPYQYMTESEFDRLLERYVELGGTSEQDLVNEIFIHVNDTIVGVWYKNASKDTGGMPEIMTYMPAGLESSENEFRMRDGVDVFELTSIYGWFTLDDSLTPKRVELQDIYGDYYYGIYQVNSSDQKLSFAWSNTSYPTSFGGNDTADYYTRGRRSYYE